LSLWNTVINANKKGLLASAKDCSSGGLALVIGKMAAVSSLGAKVTVSLNNSNDICSETFSRAVVEVSPEKEQAVESMVEGISYEKIGTVGGDEVSINDVCMDMAELKGLYFDTFKKVIEKDI